ncbi:uncharacterized protein LOC143199852 isoform X2 [Rhynchophorus ferrugineus]|uniref:uncharacterized protein LOC143199852 isoform X2 n=1 Tax=Rhynchophorus ferrugineus TaxID=354439 RepID=UPI003FCD9EC8
MGLEFSTRIFGSKVPDSLNTEATADKKLINVLLLGETGVGKSTFINSIFTYLEHEDFSQAERGKLTVLIPTKFNIFDKKGKSRTVHVKAADNENESLEVGESATQDIRTYIFKVKNGQYQVRLIDTPGMGDTRGIEQDNLNCENILNYINNIRELHAICYLCRPQQTRATSYFQYCMAQIMSRLHRDACNNFVFVFTSCRGENYTPGETFRMLERMANEISKKAAHAKLKLDKNYFCFDNEAFRYLAAVKKGVKLNGDARNDAMKSWNKATSEFSKMVNYIGNLKPHNVRNTFAINEARRIIYMLSKPMADITQFIQDNILTLTRHKESIDFENASVQELKEKLFIPTFELEIAELEKPVTVCANLKCCEVHKVGDRNEYHYKMECHRPCFLKGVPREVIGSPELINCAAMNSAQLCGVCGCSYRVHMHVYYFTKKISVNKEDESVSHNIFTREQAIHKIRQLIKNLEKKTMQYESERDVITKANAIFAHFLQKNAIAAFTDAYAEYIKYLIIREKSLEADCNISKVTALETQLQQHNEQKKIFDMAAQEHEENGLPDPISPESISELMSELFALPLSGEKIKTLFKSQKSAMKNEYSNTKMTKTLTINKVAKKNSNKSENSNATPQRSYTTSQQPETSNPKRQPPRDPNPMYSYPTPAYYGDLPAYYPNYPSDYRLFPVEYRLPPAYYHLPVVNYRLPPVGYHPSPIDYTPSSKDHRLPPSDYHPLPKGYRSPQTDYPPPSKDHRSPPADYHPLPKDYHSSQTNYLPPSKDHRSSPTYYYPLPEDYRSPPTDYPPPSKDHRSPLADHHPLPKDYHSSQTNYLPPSKDHRSSPTYYHPLPEDYRSPPTDYPPPSKDHRSPPADHHPLPKDYRLPPTDYPPPSKDHRSPPIDYHSLHKDYRPLPSDYPPPYADIHSYPTDSRPPYLPDNYLPSEYYRSTSTINHPYLTDYRRLPPDYHHIPANSHPHFTHLYPSPNKRSSSPPPTYYRQLSTDNNSISEDSDDLNNKPSSSPQPTHHRPPSSNSNSVSEDSDDLDDKTSSSPQPTDHRPPSSNSNSMSEDSDDLDDKTSTSPQPTDHRPPSSNNNSAFEDLDDLDNKSSSSPSRTNNNSVSEYSEDPSRIQEPGPSPVTTNDPSTPADLAFTDSGMPPTDNSSPSEDNGQGH